MRPIADLRFRLGVGLSRGKRFPVKLVDHERSPGGFAALLDEMFLEDPVVVVCLLILMRLQGNREYWNAGFETCLHKPVHNGLGNKNIAVDAAIHNKSCCCNAGIAACGGDFFASNGISKAPGTTNTSTCYLGITSQKPASA